MLNKRISRETKIDIVLAFIFSAFFVVYYVFFYNKSLSSKFLIVFLAYITILSFTNLLKESKIGNIIHQIVRFPTEVAVLLEKSYKVIFYYWMFFMCLLGSLIILNNIFHLFNLRTCLFFSLTITSIISNRYGNIIMNKAIKEENENKDELIQFSQKIAKRYLSQEKIRLIIYGIYLMLIIASTFITLNDLLLKFTQYKFDYIILQSFAAYFAYDQFISINPTDKK